MQVRQDQVRRRGRLVQVGREAHPVGDLAERLGERSRQRMRRIRTVHEQQPDLARAHVYHQVGQLLERSGRLQGVVGSELDGLPYLPRDIIQEVHRRDEQVGTVPIVRRHAAGYGQPALRRGELTGQPADIARLHADERRRLLGRRQQPLQPARVGRRGREPLGQDDLGHCQGQHELGPRFGRDPLVRAHPGERQARRDRDELGHRAVASTLERVRAGEPILVADRREPGLHEIGAEGHDVARVGEVVPGDGRRAERQAVALAQRLERERLIRDVAAAELFHPGVHQLAERPALEPRHEDDSLAPRLLHLRLQPGDRILPGELLPLPARPASHGIGDAVGIVESLDAGLAPRAEPPLVDRRLRVALELHHPAFAHLGVQPAARRTFATRGRVVRGDPGDLILGRDSVGNEVLGGLGVNVARRRRGGGAAGRAQDCQKPSAVHRSRLSSDTACSRARRCAARGS